MVPYFKWKGIDWQGQVSSGELFARTQKDLEKILINNQIGLMSCARVKHDSFFKPISLTIKARFFKELSILIDSGVLLPHALSVIKQQITNEQFKKVLEEIEFEIMQGASFSDVIEKHPSIFDSLIIQLIKAGQESDKLNESLLLLSEYLEKKEKFNQKLRSALFLPIITFSLFIIISLIIFLIIIPSFTTIFTFSNQEVPWLTQKMLNLSFFLRKYGIFTLIFLIVFIFILTNKIFKTKKGKLFVDRLILKLPFIGTLIKTTNLTYFLQSISLLLSGGVHLVNALELAAHSTSNFFLKWDFEKIAQSVERGKALSSSMSENKLFDSNLIAMVKVGEETGQLGIMLNRAANFYYEKSNKLLGFFLTTIQPFLMLVLGLLIAGLIFAVYIPLFNLPSIVK